MFTRAKQKSSFHLVEVGDSRPLPPLSPELRAGLEALPHQPSFDYLLRRFARQSEFLEQKLKFEHQPDVRAYDFLQSGVYWCRWLERELAALLRHPRPQATPASDTDSQAFEPVIELLQ